MLFLLCSSCAPHKQALPFSIDGEVFSLRLLGENEPYVYYAFSPEIFSAYTLDEKKSLTLNVTGDGGDKNTGTENEPYSFYAGFLFESDYENPASKKPRLKKQLSNRPLIEAENITGEVSVSLSFAADEKIVGFVVYNARVKEAYISDAQFGWNISAEIPWYGFTSAGGKTGSTEAYIPYGAYADVFIDKNMNEKERVILNVPQIGDFTVRGTPYNRIVHLDSSFFTLPDQTMYITHGEQFIQGIKVSYPKKSHAKNIEPILSDPGLVLNWQKNKWRQNDFELFAWDSFPSILIFDTANYVMQDAFFKRLAFFVEKAGYAGSLWHDSDIAHLHAFNAHDYSAKSAAAFFARAELENFPLNAHELLLKDILLERGIIRRDGNQITEGEGAIISISQESPEYLRYTFIPHELLHTLFFTDVDFRNEVADVYDNLNADARKFLLSYFTEYDSLGYDTANTYLMHNEFMAYILQQPVSRVSGYFLNTLADRLAYRKSVPDLVQYIRSTKAQDFVQAAQILNNYIAQRWNYAAGRVSLVSFEKEF